ncbi:hypothetical protein GCM10007157_22130 [Vreelandella hamiltonii]|uniref:Uncharacterized protein n=1 Tax=Vreelandella hamiltonii TaxID=502829 RepID=A0A8H9I3L0_9GAMM|nr:hypothetical protein GCM10007157_22130 [Halomonas hamiltonii]
MTLTKRAHGQYHAAAGILQRKYIAGDEVLNVDQPLIRHPAGARQYHRAQNGGSE